MVACLIDKRGWREREGREESCYDNVVTGTLDRISFTATAVLSLFNVGFIVSRRSVAAWRKGEQPR